METTMRESLLPPGERSISLNGDQELLRAQQEVSRAQQELSRAQQELSRVSTRNLSVKDVAPKA
jgi:hypothetical protein